MNPCFNRESDEDTTRGFDRLLALEFYDGPTDGVVICAADFQAYHFRLLAWDSLQSRRVFSLASIPVPTVDRLIALLSDSEPPRWPEWWFKGGASSPPLNSQVTALLGEAEAASWVVISSDLLRSTDTACHIDDDARRAEFDRLSQRSSVDSEVSDTSFDDWLKFVGDGQGQSAAARPSGP